MKEATLVSGSPRLEHQSLRKLYGRLLVRAYEHARTNKPTPAVLDLGAGDGSASLTFLDLGATVTAVDVSTTQLERLNARCAGYADRVDVRSQSAQDAVEALRLEGRQYDIAVTNSFMHHIPDYFSLIRRIRWILGPNGQFLSFQDPLRFDSVPKLSRLFDRFSYLSWRMLQGNLLRGLKTTIRRVRGIYLDDCPSDTVEYHAVRKSVDQDAISDLFRSLSYDFQIEAYYSTPSWAWQQVGFKMRIENTVGFIARKVPS